MALSYGHIRVWDAADAGNLADAMVDRLAAFEEFELSLRDAGQWKSWLNSVGATMASHHFMDFRNAVTDAAAEAKAAKNTAEQTESAVTILSHEVISVEMFAESTLFSITSSGAVIDTLAGTAQSPEAKALRAAQELQIRQTVQEIILKGREIEARAAEGLQAVLMGRIDDGGADSVEEAQQSQDQAPPPPEHDAPAVESRVWWDSLTPGQQQVMIDAHPDEIRNLWGLPTEVRDRLNRTALSDSLVTAQTDVDELQDQVDDILDSGAGPGTMAELMSLQAELRTAEEHLRMLQNTDKAATGPGRHLLEFDLTEEHPEVAISIGNPDTADNVSLSVEGYTTNVHDSVIGKARDAQNLNTAAQALAPGETHATVAFLGYQSPQKWNLTGVATNNLAISESHKVVNAVQGIAVANNGPEVNVSLFGHSYGSTTAGVAAQNLAVDGQSPVDNLALYGSPGVPEINPDPATADSLIRAQPDPSALGIDEGRAFAMTEDGDFVSEIFGEAGKTILGLGNPTSQWGFEALPMETTDVSVATDAATGEPTQFDTRYGLDDYNRINGEDVTEHSIYTKKDTISLHNLAAIAADRHDLIER